MTDVVMVAAPTQARTFQTVSPRGRTNPSAKGSRIIADVPPMANAFSQDFGKDWGHRDPPVVKLKVLSARGKE